MNHVFVYCACFFIHLASITLSQTVITGVHYDIPANDEWTALDQISSDIITTTSKKAYHGPYITPGTSGPYNWIIRQSFYCSSESNIQVNLIAYGCGTESDTDPGYNDFVRATINAGGTIQQIQTNLGGGSSWSDSELNSAAGCNSWNYWNMGPVTVNNVASTQLFWVQIQSTMTYAPEVIALSDITIECISLTPDPTKSPVTTEPTSSPVTSEPTTSAPSKTPTTSIPTSIPSATPTNVPSTPPTPIVTTYKTLNGSWNDDYSLWPSEGWTVAVQGSIIDATIVDSSSVADKRYHSFGPLDCVNNRFTMQQSFYCAFQSQVSVTYSMYYCSTENTDWIELILNGQRTGKYEAAYSWLGGTGTTWSDSALNYCTDMNGWQVIQNIGPSSIPSFIEVNELFNVTFELLTSCAGEYLAISDININCRSTATDAPTTAIPTNVPTTAIPTNVPTTKEPTTKQPTNIPTTTEPSNMPTKQPTTNEPTSMPTIIPTTTQPTGIPTTQAPNGTPTVYPTTSEPSISPTSATPTTRVPSTYPSLYPTTDQPSAIPTEAPKTPTSYEPTNAPSTPPTPEGNGEVQESTLASTRSPTEGGDADDLNASESITSSSWFLIIIILIGVCLCCVLLFCLGCRKRRKNQEEQIKKAFSASPMHFTPTDGIEMGTTGKLQKIQSISSTGMQATMQTDADRDRGVTMNSMAQSIPLSFADPNFAGSLANLAGANSLLMDDVVHDMNPSVVDDDDDVLPHGNTAGGPDLFDNPTDETDENDMTPPTNDNDDDDDDNVIGGFQTMGGDHIMTKGDDPQQIDTESEGTGTGTNEYDDDNDGNEFVIYGEDELIGDQQTKQLPPPPVRQYNDDDYDNDDDILMDLDNDAHVTAGYQ